VCNKEIKKVKREFEKIFSKECKQNQKCFWRYVNSQTKVTTGVSLLPIKEGLQQIQIEKKQRH
jgi:hypothetical protein